jgi:hypothetical protein
MRRMRWLIRIHIAAAHDGTFRSSAGHCTRHGSSSRMWDIEHTDTALRKENGNSFYGEQ